MPMCPWPTEQLSFVLSVLKAVQAQVNWRGVVSLAPVVLIQVVLGGLRTKPWEIPVPRQGDLGRLPCRWLFSGIFFKVATVKYSCVNCSVCRVSLWLVSLKVRASHPQHSCCCGWLCIIGCLAAPPSPVYQMLVAPTTKNVFKDCQVAPSWNPSPEVCWHPCFRRVTN